MPPTSFLLSWSCLLDLSTSRGLSDSARARRTCSGRVPDPLWGAPDPLWALRNIRSTCSCSSLVSDPVPGGERGRRITLSMLSETCASLSWCAGNREEERKADGTSGTLPGYHGDRGPGGVPGGATLHDRERSGKEKAKFSFEDCGSFPPFLFRLSSVTRA